MAAIQQWFDQLGIKGVTPREPWTRHGILFVCAESNESAQLEPTETDREELTWKGSPDDPSEYGKYPWNAVTLRKVLTEEGQLEEGELQWAYDSWPI